MIIFTRPAAALLLICITATLHAQTGIRLALDVESITPRWNYNVGLGVDRDLANRLAIGLDITRGWGFGGMTPESYVSAVSQEGTYTMKRNYTGIQYRCMYFFSDAGYIGSTIGLRQVNMEMTREYYKEDPGYSYSYTVIVEQRSGRATVIPLGLRIGGRTDLDGWYQDYYLGLGVNLGAGKNMFQNTMIPAKDKLSALWLVAGYAMGIGW